MPFLWATLLPLQEAVVPSVSWEAGFKSQFIQSPWNVVRLVYVLVVWLFFICFFVYSPVVLYIKWKNVHLLIIINYQIKIVLDSLGWPASEVISLCAVNDPSAWSRSDLCPREVPLSSISLAARPRLSQVPDLLSSEPPTVVLQMNIVITGYQGEPQSKKITQFFSWTVE